MDKKYFYKFLVSFKREMKEMKKKKWNPNNVFFDLETQDDKKKKITYDDFIFIWINHVLLKYS